MSHVIAPWTTAQAWVNVHPYLFAVGVVLVAAVAIRYASWSAARSIRRADRRALAAQGRGARDRGLSLSGREADLLWRMERPRWWRRSRRGRR